MNFKVLVVAVLIVALLVPENGVLGGSSGRRRRRRRVGLNNLENSKNDVLRRSKLNIPNSDESIVDFFDTAAEEKQEKSPKEKML